ncbi:cupin [Scytonema hofmannii PCC 7110]|uniref:Cupin n=1 Tax=Scytonema hofmannii PCC 7110 TaxID=128403 RepID=A0A139X6U4_9CYAN|nr:cupin domain-containing protein [Scytonema hofmannii]KYC40428.1 cupin [Scytonema hofmannii PCC 7110]
MDPKFNEIFTSPWNEVFKVVSFPDRIYHAQYLNATRCSRYRYNVQEVRSYLDIIVLKGEVYLDGQFLCNFLRVEYKSSRLVEQSREKKRLVEDELIGWIKVIPENRENIAEARVKLHYCHWTDAYQVEIWETLEPPGNTSHDYRVLDQMGYNRPITRVREFSPALQDIKAIKQVELAFRESDRHLPMGYPISDNNAAWDNGYGSTHQEPRNPEPSAPENTVLDQNYLLNFQRGWFLQTQDIEPVRYRDVMMNHYDPASQNIVEMRWVVQRELGGSMVFFHEVTVPPGAEHGAHQHIGSEELYYITEGEGIAYLRVGDDPATDKYPTVERDVMGLGKKEFKELPVKSGSVVFTKSGGMHGIRNSSTQPLKFVAFLYHTV